MFSAIGAFSGFSVDNIEKAKDFYVNTIGLNLTNEAMGLQFDLPNGGGVFIYQKDDHQAATFTILNFIVEDIEQAVSELKKLGVVFEEYDFGNGAVTDEQGIMRGLAANQGPDIAWFKDPAGNVLSVLQN